jgi:hypothetical protein
VADDIIFELSGLTKLSDLVRFQYSHCYRRTWWFIVLMTMVSLAGVLLAITVVVMTSNRHLALHNGTPFLLLLVFWGTIIAGPYLGAKRQLKSNAILSAPINWAFSSGVISRTGPHFSSEVSYEALWAVRETKTMYLLYLSSSAALILPKRFFEHASRQNAWRGFIEERIAPKRIAVLVSWAAGCKSTLCGSALLHTKRTCSILSRKASSRA